MLDPWSNWLLFVFVSCSTSQGLLASKEAFLVQLIRWMGQRNPAPPIQDGWNVLKAYKSWDVFHRLSTGDSDFAGPQYPHGWSARWATAWCGAAPLWRRHHWKMDWFFEKKPWGNHRVSHYPLVICDSLLLKPWSFYSWNSYDGDFP